MVDQNQYPLFEPDPTSKPNHAEPDAYDPNDSRRRALEEGSGASSFLARNQVDGPDNQPSQQAGYATRITAKPRNSRRGGRSYPEKSGRDMTLEHDIAEAQKPFSLTEDQKASIAETQATLRRQHAAQQVIRIMEDDPKNIALQQARLRALAERKSRGPQV